MLPLPADASDAADAADAPIGIFDSGVGGLSVLRHIRAQLPHEHLMYFADSGYAPYGAKPESVVAQRSLAVAQFLVARGAKAVVVACNTATIAAVKKLRAAYPDLPIVGVEPGLKPAAAASRSGKVAVLATDVTLSGEKFLALRDQISNATNAHFLLRGCPGLVELIEAGQLDSAATRTLLEGYLRPLLNQGADTVVLGCTHYPFVRHVVAAIAHAAGKHDAVLIDTGDAVARQLARLLAAAGRERPAGHEQARLEVFTTGSAAALAEGFANLLGLSPAVSQVRVEHISALPAPI